MAISTCVVSGKLASPNGMGIVGVTIKANYNRPILYGDGSLIMPNEQSTSSAADGTWSLTLVENASTSSSTTIAFYFPTGGTTYDRKEYTIIVPNQATANFSNLITGQT